MNLANKITLFRILSVPFFIACILYYSENTEYLRFLGLGIFVLASLSDAVDGIIARKRKEITELGTILDPIADKLLIISAFISLSNMKHLSLDMRIPGGILLIVLTRDIIIILGSLISYFLKGNIIFKPTILGKITTFLQMSSIIILLSMFKYNKYIMYPVVLFTVLSGIHYIIRGSKELGQ